MQVGRVLILLQTLRNSFTIPLGLARFAKVSRLLCVYKFVNLQVTETGERFLPLDSRNETLSQAPRSRDAVQVVYKGSRSFGNRKAQQCEARARRIGTADG